MDEPWLLKEDDSRSTETIHNFILFCEDEKGEPDYFRGLANKFTNIKITSFRGRGSGFKNITDAINYCKKNGIVDSISDGFIGDHHNVWCIFDRDKSRTSVSASQDIAFSSAVRLAESMGIKVGWSNDAFELFVLLHFVDVSKSETALEHRDECYERLTSLCLTMPNKSDRMIEMTSNANFNYCQLKRNNNFIFGIRSYLMEKWEEAITRAEYLEGQYADGLDPHEKKVCTVIFKLSKTIRELGFPK